MSFPTLAIRTLTCAIGIGLVHPALSFAPPSPPPYADSPSPDAAQVTLVTFGADGRSGKTREGAEGAATVAAGGLSDEDIVRLASAPPGSVLAAISSSELPLPAAEFVALSRLYERGVPFLLHMDSLEPDDLRRTSAIFGMAPTSGDVILLRDPQGRTQVFSSGGSTATTAALMSAVASEMEMVRPRPERRARSRRSIGSMSAASEQPASPTKRFSLNLVDDKGEVGGVTLVDVVRSRTNSADAKVVMITSRVTLTTERNGITEGNHTGQNLWAAYLPFEYRLEHTLTADGVQPGYRSHFPETDPRTEYNETKTESRGFSIGGSTGSELSGSGKPDDKLAAKLPLNLSLGFDHRWEESIARTFKDYSLLAVLKGPSSVRWTALIAPSLKGVLVRRFTAGLPELTDKGMTAMMRSASLNTVSEWVLPGAYEGLAEVAVSAGYELRRDEWWWRRAELQHLGGNDRRDVPFKFVVDMSDPYLTSDITVLIRTATGTGACLQDEGDVTLGACNPSDRRQMWGMDASSRYVNRGSGHCLTADVQSRKVVTKPCAVSFEQQWQWRADRLHALIDQSQYRLYVDGDQVRYHAFEGQVQDFPVNPYGAPIEPWTNYPDAPRPGIDMQPAPAGSRALDLPEEWRRFGPVSAEQRWHIEVLRQGL